MAEISITEKKILFAREVFCNGGNRAAAARAVGYGDRVAKQMGSKLYKDSIVQEELERLKQDFHLTSVLTDEEKAEMKETVADLKETLERTTRILRREEPEEIALVLKTDETSFENGVKTTEHKEEVKIVETKTKVSDSLKAAELLLKYHYRSEDKRTDGTETVGGVVFIPQIKEE